MISLVALKGSTLNGGTNGSTLAEAILTLFAAVMVKPWRDSFRIILMES